MTNQTANIDTLIDRGRWTAFHTLTVSLCAAVTVIDGFDTQAIAFVAPVLIKEWSQSAAAFGPVFSAGLIGMMLGALALGPVADRWGRKIAIVASVALIGAFSIATAYATSVEQLLALRFLTGLGLGGAMPNVIALCAEYTPARWRSTAVGIMFCGFPLGAVAGGLVGAQIIPAFGWQSTFVLGGILPLLLFLVLLFALPESVRFLASRPGREAAVIQLMARVVPDENPSPGMRFMTAQVPNDDLSSARAEIFAPGRIASTLMLWTAFFMNLLIFYFLVNWLPLILQQAGIDLSRAILFVALLNAFGIVGTIVLARTIDRVSSFRILVPALVAGALAIFAMGFVGSQGNVALFVSISVAGFCIVGVQNNLNALAAGLYTTQARSTGVGFALAAGRVGSIIGPIVGGLLLAAQMSLTTLFFVGGLPAFIAALALWGLIGKEQAAKAVASAGQV